MKVLVTGANGYIGRHVVSELLDRGVDVIASDINNSNIDPRANFISVDIFNLPDVNIYEYMGSPDICLHMAWRNGFVHNAPSHIGDLSGHFKFMSALVKGGLRQLAVMGTMHEIGYWEGAVDEKTPCNPISLYGIANDTLRKCMQHVIAESECLFQWLRCFYITGDDIMNNSIFCKILKAAQDGEKTFPFTSGKNKYDFISVDELAHQISSAIMQKKITGIINCCSGNPVSLGAKVEEFIRENKLGIRLDYGAFPDRLYDSPCIYGNPTKIRMILEASK